MSYPATLAARRAFRARPHVLLSMYITTLSRQGQITLPVGILQHLGLTPKDALRIEPIPGGIKIVPLRPAPNGTGLRLSQEVSSP